jgi:predicted alpha/beta-hydrolase family hydrolase
MDKPHISVFTPAIGEPIARFVFAHGAGASMDSDFMVAMANKIAAQGIEVFRFNFAYMQTMSETGKRRPPNRMPALLADYLTVVDAQPSSLRVFIGGKSMGGRVATMLATQPEVKNSVKGVVALGYPFHPSGKPDKLRISHLPDQQCPCLIIQGDRDPLGSKAEIETYDLQGKVAVIYLTDGEHSFKPRKASGVTLQDNLNEATKHIAEFIKENQ